MAAFEILAAQLSKPLSTLASFDVEKFVRPNKDSFQLPQGKLLALPEKEN